MRITITLLFFLTGSFLFSQTVTKKINKFIGTYLYQKVSKKSSESFLKLSLREDFSFRDQSFGTMSAHYTDYGTYEIKNDSTLILSLEYRKSQGSKTPDTQHKGTFLLLLKGEKLCRTDLTTCYIKQLQND